MLVRGRADSKMATATPALLSFFVSTDRLLSRSLTFGDKQVARSVITMSLQPLGMDASNAACPVDVSR